MREIDELALALAKALGLIIALPLKTVSWAVRVARLKFQRASQLWTKRGSRKSQKQVAKNAGKLKKTSLEKFRLYYEELPKDKKRWGKKSGRKLHK